MAALFLLLPLGLILGLLIVYLADVLPYKRRLTRPVCAYCGNEMDWKAYFNFRPCADCGKSRRSRNRFVPLLAVIVVCLLWYVSPLNLPVEVPFGVAVLVLGLFTLVVITDLEYHAVLTEVSIAGGILGLITGLMRNSVVETLLGGAAGFGVMLLLYLFGRLFGRWLAKRRGVTLEDTEALGFGDVNLGGIIGLILGWPAVIAGLFLAIVLGGVTGLALVLMNALAKRYHVGMFIPYAPFLVLAVVILLFMPW